MSAAPSGRWWHLAPILCTPLLLAGCATPEPPRAATGAQPPLLAERQAVMDDGHRLPLHRWGEPDKARALVLALHGFNDYGNAFAGLGERLAAAGVLTYAVDQRGFGAGAGPGRWAGEERMTADLVELAALLRERHPGLPLYVLGESMGGAVVMATPRIAGLADGLVLIAPAVWSRETMHPLQRFVLALAAYGLPSLKLTGRGLDIRPSDNIPMLRQFSADPLVIKETRVDALWGLTNLMDQAAAAAPGLAPPALILYGEHDQIIPRRAFCAMLATLPPAEPAIRVVLYRDGWHMLTRDLQGERVMSDIAAWVNDQRAALPSGEEAPPGSERMARHCRDAEPLRAALRQGSADRSSD